jgi:hypothetical protein
MHVSNLRRAAVGHPRFSKTGEIRRAGFSRRGQLGTGLPNFAMLAATDKPSIAARERYQSTPFRTKVHACCSRTPCIQLKGDATKLSSRGDSLLDPPRLRATHPQRSACRPRSYLSQRPDEPSFPRYIVAELRFDIEVGVGKRRG